MKYEARKRKDLSEGGRVNIRVWDMKVKVEKRKV